MPTVRKTVLYRKYSCEPLRKTIHARDKKMKGMKAAAAITVSILLVTALALLFFFFYRER